jgi:hypothetical protein
MPQSSGPLDEDERELMDPRSWDWESAEDGVTVGNPGAIFMLEFSRQEHNELARAAQDAGMTTHEFIKRAALAALSAPTR